MSRYSTVNWDEFFDITTTGRLNKLRLTKPVSTYGFVGAVLRGEDKSGLSLLKLKLQCSYNGGFAVRLSAAGYRDISASRRVTRHSPHIYAINRYFVIPLYVCSPFSAFEAPFV